jgi:hypothetical protein
MSIIGTWWMGTPGSYQYQYFSLVSGGFIFVGIYDYEETGVPVIYKIDSSTMTTAGSWSSVNRGYGVYHMCTDGTYLYVSLAHNDATAEVVKIRISDMTEVDRWTGSADEDDYADVAYMAGYVYCATYDPDGKVCIKINVSNMEEVDRWSSAVSFSNDRGITVDGTYVYVTRGSRIYQIDPSTMEEVDYYSYSLWGGLLAYNGYLYATRYTSTPYMYKINPAGMDYVSQYSPGAVGTGFANNQLFQIGSFIWSCLADSPFTLYEVDPSDMSLENSFTPESGVWFSPFCTDGTNIYAAGYKEEPPPPPSGSIPKNSAAAKLLAAGIL